MGQTQSKAPTFHPSSIGSHNYADVNAERIEEARPYPTSGAGWIKRPRSRFMSGRRISAPSTDIISYPHHQFIPKEQRQRSAGPIRKRPQPSEYALRPAPTPPSPLTSSRFSQAPAAAGQSAASSGSHPWTASKVASEPAETKSVRRTSAHRVSATPRDPPLLEEPESNRDQIVVDGHPETVETPPSASDHGHPPVPIPPGLALALKAGLGSGSLRRTHDGELVADKHESEAIRASAGTPGNPPRRSSGLENATDLDTRIRRASIPEGWQSEWKDLRHRPTDDQNQQPSCSAADCGPISRFSFGSSGPTTSSGTQSGAESGRRGSSLYATPLDPGRFSYTASESSDSAQLRTSISIPRKLMPADGRSGLPSNDGLLAPPRDSDSPDNAREGHSNQRKAPSHERSITSLLSAAAASSDCDPTLSHDHRDSGVTSTVNNPCQETRPVTAEPVVTVHRAFDRYEEPASYPVASSRTSSMLHSVHSDAAASHNSSLGTSEVEQLRRGPEVRLHEDLGGPIFDVQPAPTSRRPRALSLMDRLRGMTSRAPEASTAKPDMVTVQALPGVSQSNIGSTRTRLRSLSHAQATNRPTAPSFQPIPTLSQAHRNSQSEQPRSMNVQSPASLQEANSVGQRIKCPSTRREEQHSRSPNSLVPRAAIDLSRPTSIRSVKTQRSIRSVRSFTSSNGSLRARYKIAQSPSSGFSSSRVRSLTAHRSSQWWKQNHLKRKGSEGIVAEAQAAKQGRPGAASTEQASEAAEWVDVEPEPKVHPLRRETLPTNTQSSLGTTSEVKPKNKEAGGLWIWPRRPSATRGFSFGLSKDPSLQAERVEIEPISPTRTVEKEHTDGSHSPVNVIGMSVDMSASLSRTGMGGRSTGNSSQASFTSLAPPVPPAPVPPLRRPRRGPNRTFQTSLSVDRSDSADSAATLNPMDATVGLRGHHWDRSSAASNASLMQSDTTASLIPGTAPSLTGASLPMEATSTAATSVSASTSTQALPSSGAVSKGVGLTAPLLAKPGSLSPSPTPTMSRQMSEVSDAGTKEVLLSEPEPLAASKDHAQPFIHGPLDEQHPDLHTFYPAGTSIARPVRHVEPAIISPLSPMSEEECRSTPSRRVGAVPDLSSPPASLSTVGCPDRTIQPHIPGSGFTETNHSLRSTRSIRSISDGSVKRYHPLPSIPARPRGYSADLAMDRRDPSYGADSFVTADTHDLYEGSGQPSAERRDGLPVLDTHFSPLMLMGMVTAASSPTQWTHSSHGQISPGAEGSLRETQRSSTTSRLSPVAGPRPLPSIPVPSLDAAVETAVQQTRGTGPKRSNILAEGPPLSPSAFYERSYVVQPNATKASAGPRNSWNSADEPWSADVVTSGSMLSSVRGMARPERAVSNADALRRALSQPADHVLRAGDSDTSLHAGGNDDDDAELTRLEKSRSGSKMMPSQQRMDTTELPDSMERAPYADTGVQASLAALRALESPGESLRTILARQRMFGEPDAAVTEFLRESRILESEPQFEDEEVLSVSGPRHRRRAAPYPRLSDTRYSSEELSSSGRSLSGRQMLAAKRRRRQNYTGMAEVSSSSLADTSGRGSDSEGATLAVARLARLRARKQSSGVPAADHRSARRSSAYQRSTVNETLPSTSYLEAWEDLAGLGTTTDPNKANTTTSRPRDIAVPGQKEREARTQRPHHERYVTALSHPSETSTEDAQKQLDPPAPAGVRALYGQDDNALSPYANATSPASTMSPALLLKHERVASQVPSSGTFAGGRIAFPSSVGTQGLMSSMQQSMRSPSLPHDLSDARQRISRGSDGRGGDTERFRKGKDPTVRHTVAPQRQRSSSDVHVSSARNKRVGQRSEHVGGETSRYDAQLEDLLLLREKVAQLENVRGHLRFDSLDTSLDHGGMGPLQDAHSYSVDRSARRPRKSSTSSKHRSRPSKLGYTLPDIMAWQAGLGNSQKTSRTVIQ